MTSTETPWTDAKIAALANRDRSAVITLSALTVVFLLITCLAVYNLHHLAR